MSAPAVNSPEDILARCARGEIDEHEMHVLFAGGLSPRRDSVTPGSVYPTDRLVPDASPSSRAPNLADLGYTPTKPANWAKGQSFTIGSNEYHWHAGDWHDGPAP